MNNPNETNAFTFKINRCGLSRMQRGGRFSTEFDIR